MKEAHSHGKPRRSCVERKVSEKRRKKRGSKDGLDLV
jgi:hypothetical protein